jgi:hypothetical protein
MEGTSEKIKKLEKILEKEDAPILKYFNVGLPRDEVVAMLLKNGIHPNESLISLYEWHNGVSYKNGDDFYNIELFPTTTFYDLEWAFTRRDELIGWEIVDSPELYLPIFGSLEGDMYLFKNDNKGEIFNLVPGANIYGEMEFRSIDIMLDVLADCYVEKIFEIDSTRGLNYSFKKFRDKVHQYK